MYLNKSIPLSATTHSSAADPSAAHTLLYVLLRITLTQTHYMMLQWKRLTLSSVMECVFVPWKAEKWQAGACMDLNSWPVDALGPGLSSVSPALSHGKTKWLETNCQEHTANRHPCVSRPLSLLFYPRPVLISQMETTQSDPALYIKAPCHF